MTGAHPYRAGYGPQKHNLVLKIFQQKHLGLLATLIFHPFTLILTAETAYVISQVKAQSSGHILILFLLTVRSALGSH